MDFGGFDEEMPYLLNETPAVSVSLSLSLSLASHHSTEGDPG